MEREIEDVAALIYAAGAPATVLGWYSGAGLALDATAAGLPISRLTLFEPPFIVNNSRPPLPADYVARLDAAVADGRPGDAVELFMTAEAGLPAKAVDAMRRSAFWSILEAVAPTIAYDGRIMGTTTSGNPRPRDRWATVTAPTLVIHGTGTYPFIITSAHALAELLSAAVDWPDAPCDIPRPSACSPAHGASSPNHMSESESLASGRICVVCGAWRRCRVIDRKRNERRVEVRLDVPPKSDASLFARRDV